MTDPASDAEKPPSTPVTENLDPVLPVILDTVMLLLVAIFTLSRLAVSGSASSLAPAMTPPGFREALGAGDLAIPGLWFGGLIVLIVYAFLRSRASADLPFAAAPQAVSSTHLRLLPVLLVIVGAQSIGAGLAAAMGLRPKSRGPRLVALDGGQILRVPVSLKVLADPSLRAPDGESAAVTTSTVTTTLKTRTTLAPTEPRVAASPGTSMIAVYPTPAGSSASPVGPLRIADEEVRAARFLADGQVLELGGHRWRFEAGAAPPRGKLLFGAVTALLTIIGILIVVFTVAGPDAVGLAPKSVKGELLRGLRLYLAAAPGFLIAYFASIWLVGAAGLHVVSHPVEGLIGEGGFATLALAVLSSCVLAPVLEELLFRGLLLRAMVQFLPARVAIGIGAVVFAALHLGLQTVLPLTFLGALWGWMSLTGESKSIIAPMAAHALHNCVVFASYFIVKPLIAG